MTVARLSGGYFLRLRRLCSCLRFLRPIFLRPDFFSFGLLRPMCPLMVENAESANHRAAASEYTQNPVPSNGEADTR